MTLPGAETIKAGIRGVDCRFLPLICGRSKSSWMSLTIARPLVRSDMSTDGEDGELLSVGVRICGKLLLELDLECDCCIWRGFPRNDRLVEGPVIARRACSRGAARQIYSGEGRRAGLPRQSDTGRCSVTGGWLADTVTPMHVIIQETFRDNLYIWLM